MAQNSGKARAKAIRRIGAMIIASLFVATALTMLAERPAHARDVVLIPGQVDIDQCPADHRAALGILVDIGTGIFTECYAPDPAYEAEMAANREFQQRIDAATAAAELESQAWAQAHPGQQKCIQWGPVVHSNGVSTASGGVCANPVPVADAPPTQEPQPSSPPQTGGGDAQAPAGDASLSTSYLGTVAQMPNLIAAATADKVESARIIMQFYGFGRLTRSAAIGKPISLPKSAGLASVYRSATPQVCTVNQSKAIVTARKAGTCRIILTVKNSSGDTFSAANAVSIKKPS